MGRPKGATYRKEKFKEVKRIKNKGWTINENLLSQLSRCALSLNRCESHIVEVAINIILNMPEDKLNKSINLERIFTKS